MSPQTSGKIRIVLAEDQALIRGALTALLELEPDLQVVAEADNGNTALQLALQHQPDILLTDIEMPQMNGLELAEHLLRIRSHLLLQQRLEACGTETFSLPPQNGCCHLNTP